MVVVSHLFFFLRKYFRGRCDSGESHRPLSGTIYFPTAPGLLYVCVSQGGQIPGKGGCLGLGCPLQFLCEEERE